MATHLDDVYETRRQNLTNLLSEPGAKTQLATRLGASQAHITHLLKPPTAASARAIREETARQIEEIMGLERGRLDRPDFVVYRQGDKSATVIEAKSAPSAPTIKKSRGRAIAQYTNEFLDHMAPPGARESGTDLLEESFRTVLEALTERRLTLAPDKTAKMARLVFEQAQVTGRVDATLVSSLISLMA